MSTPRLTLHLSHPVGGLVIEDCLYDGFVCLHPTGFATRFAVRTRPDGFDEYLAFDWRRLAQDGLNFEVTGGRRDLPGGEVQRSLPTPVLTQEGGRVRGLAKLGDRFDWLDWAIVVKELAVPGPRLTEMSDRARTDDAALEVLADFLESGGSADAAAWARSMIHPMPIDQQLRLSRRLPLSLRALLARGPVERCARRCTQTWQALPLEAPEPWLRRCAQCQQAVAWCDAPSPTRVPPQGPVVIAPCAERSSFDLLGMPIVG